MTKDHARLGRWIDAEGGRQGIGMMNCQINVLVILEEGVLHTRGNDGVVLFARWKHTEGWVKR